MVFGYREIICSICNHSESALMATGVAMNVATGTCINCSKSKTADHSTVIDNTIVTTLAEFQELSARVSKLETMLSELTHKLVVGRDVP